MAELRTCIGSARFGIEPHEAPVADFPVQPSQRDRLGRMCKTHWNQYTAGLARDAKVRKAAEATSVVAEPVADRNTKPERRAGAKARTPKPEPIRTKAPRPPARRSKRPQVDTNHEVAIAEPPLGITVLSRDEDGFEAVIAR